MKLVLVGVDGSEESFAATDSAAKIAKGLGAGLKLAYVVPEPIHQLPEDYQQSAAWLAELREYGKEALREAARRGAANGVQVEETTAAGSPPQVLADMAEHPDVSLVVVGHRGRNSVARLLLGSVADRLVQISPKPVLVVR